MKKIILSTFLLFAFSLIFAETNVIDEIKSSNSHFIFKLGDTNYGTLRLAEFSYPKEIQLKSNSFTMELGDFSSDEDGLFDWVSFAMFGFGWGKVDSDGYRVSQKSNEFILADNAKHFNIYGKKTYGLQMNMWLFSLGGTFGPKYGFDHMKQEAIYNNEQYKFGENRVFVDFSLNPYFSLNVFDSVKIFFSSDFDLPVFRVRFLNHKRNSYKSDTTIRLDWFKNDIPVTYMIGASFLF